MTEETIIRAESATMLPEMDSLDRDENNLANLAGNDPDGKGVWADRLAAYDPGEIEAFDFDEVMPHFRVEYGWT